MSICGFYGYGRFNGGGYGEKAVAKFPAILRSFAQFARRTFPPYSELLDYTWMESPRLASPSLIRSRHASSTQCYRGNMRS
jgi:hypothetical protein